MNRKLRTLGLALFAAFAMSAVGASGASAAQDHFTSNVATTHLTAKATNNQVTRTTTNGADQTGCTGINFKGTITGKEVTEVTVEPSFTGCTATKGGTNFAMTKTTNGCHFRFTTETTTTATPGEHATMHIECPVGKSIEVDVTALKIPCLTIGPQSLHGVRYSNHALNSHAIEIEMTIHGIHTKELETSACNEATHTDGQYTGNITVEGFEDAAHTKTADLGVIAT